ncbi:MAG TPA: hypothetical protein VJY64_01785 [Candidatus Onthovivens sp.]|nr:hypothetical protein [Candidatus Onthovivens sp.]
MKKKYLSLLLVASSVLLGSCGKAVAGLKDPEAPIVVDKNGNAIDVDGNTMKQIYDIIRLGNNYQSDVKEILNDLVGEIYIGNFVIGNNGEISISFNDKILDEKNDTELFEFVKSHNAYWNWERTDVSVTYEEAPSLSNINDYRQRIDSVKELISKEIVKSIFTSANSSSNKKNNRFYEVLFARSIYSKLYTIYDNNGKAIPGEVLYTDPDYKNQDSYSVDEYGLTSGALITPEYNAETNPEGIIGGDQPLINLLHYKDYINNDIIPGIIRTLLTQQYVFEKQYAAIGRTQSRQVNYITLSDNTYKDASALLKQFALTNIVNNPSTDSQNYDVVIDAWNADPLSLKENKAAADLAKTIFGEAKTDIPSKNKQYIDGKVGADYPYYEGSKYGDIITNYSKLTNNPTTNDATEYTNFTSLDGITYTPSEGLAIKTNNLAVSSYVTKTWGTSDSFSGISNSDITNKLFSYGLAREFITAKDDNTSFAVDGQYIKQFAVDGPTYLKKDTYSSENNGLDSIIWEDSGTFYIIEVLDQVSPSTLATSTETTKEELKVIEDYAREIGYDVSSSSTYTNNALTHFLKQLNLTFYDQSLYDYFNENFPKLFE